MASLGAHAVLGRPDAAPALKASAQASRGAVLAHCASALAWGGSAGSLASSHSCSLKGEGEAPLFDCQGALAPCAMAVPKKHKSRTKTKIHRAVWKLQARAEAKKALSLAKSVLTGRAKGFIYVQDDKPGKKEGEGPEEEKE